MKHGLLGPVGGKIAGEPWNLTPLRNDSGARNWGRGAGEGVSRCSHGESSLAVAGPPRSECGRRGRPPLLGKSPPRIALSAPLRTLCALLPFGAVVVLSQSGFAICYQAVSKL